MCERPTHTKVSFGKERSTYDIGDIFSHIPSLFTKFQNDM